MRPGAAVRLKGTWVDETRKESNNDAESSQTPEAPKTPANAELQVSEVEVLGHSDPQV